MRKFATIVLFLLISSASFAVTLDSSLVVNGISRTYHLFIPDNLDPSKTHPVVFLFHGGGGNGAGVMHFTRFNDLAETQKFILMCPDGYNKHWNDGREATAVDQSQDDVKFITMLMDDLVTHYHADTKRMFVTGISNGGIFSLYLLQKIPERLAGVAAMCASIPQNEMGGLSATHFVPTMIMNGTADPIVKYAGGPVLAEGTNHGAVIGTDAMIQILVANNNCRAIPDSQQIANIDLRDGCHATRFTYRNCAENTSLVFVKIYGGGHCWPGAAQYLPKGLIGNVCRDFNATNEIWNFFKNLPAKNQ